ncbi:MAG TPA: hypothetical protein VFQ84_12400 [Arenimonas sp.]|uniref:hypothetical protein n=1 Tax=Arenimonas sp. TaxID=1872635 RepID=UPI002D7F631D|nr:hypothetical protein [Arenimonas sp.]HEU0154133.1 hypothetical protein [Arenimonas sp.]
MLGLILMVIGGLWTLFAAFSTSIWWGLGCLLFSPAALVFLILHWDVAKNPFFLQLVGVALWYFGSTS